MTGHLRCSSTCHGLVFSGDGKHFAYAAKTGGKWFVVVDGRPRSPHAEVIDGLKLSNDAKHVVYKLRGDRSQRVCLDGQLHDTYLLISDVWYQFSPGGDHFVYLATDRTLKEVVVFDGKQSPEFMGFLWMAFSPDGRRFAYGARDGKSGFVRVDGSAIDLAGGQPGKSALRFSPDSRRLQVLGHQKLAGVCENRCGCWCRMG